MRMRNMLLFVGGLALMAGCSSSESESEAISTDIISGEAGTPQIHFDKTHHNFGNVDEGAQLEYSFKFTNVGHGELLITDASASCGCTVPKWPTRPIKPGESEYIPVMFNTEGRKDVQNKTITIIANTKSAQTRISIAAFVIPKNEN